MKKIVMKEFIDIIINATAADNKTEIRLTEYDGDSIFSIEVNKDENILYLDIPGDNKYDTIFEGLKKNFDGRYQTVVMHDMGGNYKGYMILDNKVVIVFNYMLSEGQDWLYEYQ